MRRRLLLAGVWLLGVAALWWWPPTPIARVEADGLLAVAADGVVVTADPSPLPPDRRDPSRPPTPAQNVFYAGPVVATDLFTGRRLWTALGPADGVAAEATEDGRRLLVQLGEPGDWRRGDIEVRDAATGERVGRFQPNTGFSPPDARLALVPHRDPADPGSPGPVFVFDLHETAGGRWLRRLPGGPGPEFTPGGRRLIVPHVGRAGGSVYDTGTGRLLARIAEPRFPGWFGPDHLTGEDGVIRQWDGMGGVGRRAGEYYDPAGRWSSERADGTDDAGRPAVVWTLHPGGERRAEPPAGFRVSSWSAAAGGRLVEANLVRDRPPGAVARWLAGRHPAFFRLGWGSTDRRTRLLDPDTAAVVAELPEDTHFEQLSADGRTLVTRTWRAGRPTTVEAWAVPARPRWWLIAGWTAVGSVVAWRLSTRPTPPPPPAPRLRPGPPAAGGSGGAATGSSPPADATPARSAGGG